MQTIETRFLGPTDRRGSRYKARTSSGITLTLESEDALDSVANHERVARALIHKLGWFHDSTRADRYGDWYSGGLKGGGFVFVCCVEYAKLEQTTKGA